MNKTTKQHIIRVSLSLFSSLGYSGASIRNIASNVGIRESAVYNHFKSKKDIYSECIEYVKESFNDSEIFTDELLDELSNPEKFLIRATNSLFEKWKQKENREILRFVILSQDNAENLPPVSIDTIVEDAQKIWILVFTEMTKHKFIIKMDPEILAAEYYYPLFTARLKYCLNESQPKKIEHFIANHVKYFWNSIKKVNDR